MATPLPLEGDGLIENLFYFLWCKDDFGAGPRIYIPHTVLYKFAQPSAWYFTSVKSGKIKKKAKVNLNNVQIEHEFTKKRSASDIVAYYIYFANASRSGNASGDSGHGAATTIEYFDADALRDFLYKREKTQNGMLQKFVLPKGTSNATVRAIWSPKICLLERRVNVRNVHDKRYSIYERGVTFDGADVHSRPEPVRGAMLPGEVQLLCEQIVDHVTQVSYHKYRIARMVLHLKCDADDKLWLLWCSSLRLLNVNATEAAPMRPLDIVNDAQVPEFAMQLSRQSSAAAVGLSPSMSSSSISSGDMDERRMGFTRCTSCGRQVEQKKLLATTYKAVLDHFQRFLRFLRLQVNESEHAAIEWPPDERLVQAAGGVGFGILYANGKSGSSSVKRASISSTSSATSSAASGSASGALTRKELIIPPVIQFLHPTFTVDDFERHRHDPLFLHKPVGVCESCCLVYADYTTSSLEVNSIRPSAPAILRPHCELSDAKKRLDPLDPLAVALAASNNNNSTSGGLASPPGARKSAARTKPPASAWKPVTSDPKATALSKMRATGPRSTLSTWPSAPQLPQRIDSFDDVHAASFADLPLASGSGAGLSSSQGAHALQQREETFFRELNQQKDLERGHPLHHMLESATRLASTKKQQQLAALRLSTTNATHAFDSSSGGLGKSRSIGALPELLEQQLAGKKASTKSPYSIVLRLRESTTTALDASLGDEHSASELQLNQQSPVKQTAGKTAKKRAGARGSKKKKKRTAKSKTVKAENDSDGKSDDGDDNDDDEASDAQQRRRQMRFVSEREKKASEEHQDFLFAALSQAQAQLEHMESLASLLPDMDEPHLASSPLYDAHDGVEQDSDGDNDHRAGDDDQDEVPLEDPEQHDADTFADQDAPRTDVDLEPHLISDLSGEGDRDDVSGDNKLTNGARGEVEPEHGGTEHQDIDASVDQVAPSVDQDAEPERLDSEPFATELDTQDGDTHTCADDDGELHDSAYQISDGNGDEVAQSILLDVERALLDADPSSNEHDIDDGSDDHDHDSSQAIDGEQARFDDTEPYGVDDSADPVAPCPDDAWHEDKSASAAAVVDDGDAQRQAVDEDDDDSESPYPT